MDQLLQLLTGDVHVVLQGVTFFVRTPSLRTRQLASIYANKKKTLAFEEGVLTLDEAVQMAVDSGCFSYEEDELLQKTLPKNIEKMKRDYFRNFSFGTRYDIIKNIKSLEKKITDLHNRKHTYYQFTCEYIYSLAYENYVLENSIYKDEDKVHYSCFSLDQLKKAYHNNKIPQEEIREVSKSKEWKTIWSAGRESDIFGSPISHLNQDQIELINWSRTYDSVYKSMDCPSEAVINDNLALDGWFIDQANKRESEEKKQKHTNNSKGGDVFIPVRNQQEVDDVISMNNQEGRGIIKSLAADLRKKGNLKEGELTSVRNKLQMEINKGSKK